jgi:hypothetical protein
MHRIYDIGSQFISPTNRNHDPPSPECQFRRVEVSH